MKNKFKVASIAGAVMVLTGCGSTLPVGAIITDVNLPIAVTSVNSVGTKTGEASCISYLSMIAKGDCSIEAAKKNGNITTVTSVDWHYDTILGIVNNYKVTVHGK